MMDSLWNRNVAPFVTKFRLDNLFDDISMIFFLNSLNLSYYLRINLRLFVKYKSFKHISEVALRK